MWVITVSSLPHYAKYVLVLKIPPVYFVREVAKVNSWRSEMMLYEMYENPSWT